MSVLPSGYRASMLFSHPVISPVLNKVRSEVLFRNSQLSSPALKPKVFSAALSVFRLTLPINTGALSAVSLWNNKHGRPATVVRTFGSVFCASVRMFISFSMVSIIFATPVLCVPDDSAKSVLTQKTAAGRTSSVTWYESSFIPVSV